jgi:hypothetical protein
VLATEGLARPAKDEERRFGDIKTVTVRGDELSTTESWRKQETSERETRERDAAIRKRGITAVFLFLIPLFAR